MCIIAAKPAGVKMMSMDTLENMWDNNRDGAGFMYALNNRVIIEKGFMKWAEFEEAITWLGEAIDLDNISIVFHFRITTHGGTKPSNCHPFPVTRSIEKMSKLRTTTNLGVAHNGIIPIEPRKGISDTMEYVATQLAPLASAMPEFYKNAYAMELVENAIGSKMAILNNEGEIYTIGKFEECDGIYYSNGTYKETSWLKNFNYYSGSEGGWSMFNGYYDADLDLKLLMWGDYLEDGTVITDPNGNVLGDFTSEIAIDKECNVYLYDPDWDAFERTSFIAYDSNGMRKCFREEDASKEYIIVGH